MLSITIPFELVSNNFSKKISSTIMSPCVSAISDVAGPVTVFGLHVCVWAHTAVQWTVSVGFNFTSFLTLMKHWLINQEGKSLTSLLVNASSHNTATEIVHKNTCNTYCNRFYIHIKWVHVISNFKRNNVERRSSYKSHILLMPSFLSSMMTKIQWFSQQRKSTGKRLSGSINEGNKLNKKTQYFYRLKEACLHLR